MARRKIEATIAGVSSMAEGRGGCTEDEPLARAADGQRHALSLASDKRTQLTTAAIMATRPAAGVEKSARRRGRDGQDVKPTMLAPSPTPSAAEIAELSRQAWLRRRRGGERSRLDRRLSRSRLAASSARGRAPSAGRAARPLSPASQRYFEGQKVRAGAKTAAPAVLTAASP